MSSPASVASLIQSAAPQYGIPPSLFLAVAQHESSLNQGAVGTSGEIGVFQLMPATAKSLGVNPASLQQNIDGAGTLLQQLYAKYGNWTQALEAYNWGEPKLNSTITAGTAPPAVVQSYASDILAASGVSDTSSPSDLAITSPTSDPFASIDSLDLGSLLDTSQPSFYIAAGLLAFAVVLAWRRG